MVSNNWRWCLRTFHRLSVLVLFTALFWSREAAAQQCDFYPIALSAQQLSNAAPGTVLTDIYNGTQPGNFGWLSWGGSPSETTLVTSLTVPGNSSTYVNPDKPSDHQISIGDWISAKPGVSNSKNVRDALDALKSIDITIPVWDQTRGSGDHAAYRVANFARVRLIGYQLPGQNRITARFLGFTTCGHMNLAPVVDAGADITSAVHALPVTVNLAGSVIDDGLPNNTLTSSWSLLSGPGTVTFANSSAPATTATLSASGTYVLQLSATDGELSSSNTVIVTVNRTNQVPQALAQTVTIDEDSVANITLQGTDPDNDAITFQVVSLPQFGTLAGTPPNLTYMPKPDYNGTDSFAFKVNDGQLDSAPATVSIVINPVNDAPVADSIVVTNFENSSSTFTLSGSDVEGSALTFVLLSVPAHGTLNVQTGTLASPQVVYTPDTNYSGNDGFTFKVNDGELDSAIATVSITNVAVNLPPDVDAGPDQIVSEPTNSVVLQGIVTDDNFLGYDSVTVEWTKVSGPGSVTFTNATSRTTMATFSQPGVYVLRLTADDTMLETGDDVQITFNGAPVVIAGADQTETLPATVTLNGSATDDGLPTGSALAVSWEKVSGPGTVVFGDSHLAATTASFSESGIYALRLTASDSLVSRSSDVTVTINSAPIVDAGANQLVTNLQATLNGTVYDDGLPSATLSTSWMQVSGPGAVTFADSTSPATTATFSASGVYVLRLTANDGLATSTSDVTVTVDGVPVVDAGTSQTVNFPNVMILHGTVTDDGVPIGSPNISWTQVSGPGTITFGDIHSATTSASASAGGVYVLRLTGDDTLATNSAEVTVKFNRAPVAQSQSVSAPEGQPTTISLIGTDPDGDALQFFTVQTPHLGVLSGTGSNITYTANVGTYGSDAFTFYVTDGLLTSAVATVSVQVVPFARGRTYTSNTDFQQGSLTSLLATNDQLQTVVDLTQFNYVWVPVQSRGTIIRLDADTGRPLGEYRLYPDGLSNAFPSRIAVDSRGNCWVANERDNSVLEIATPESDWVDKNHNGVLDTSQGQGDIRPWTNPLGVDSNGGTTTAQDELVVRYVRTTDPGSRFVAVNRNDDVWVGGTSQQVFDLIDHTTGRLVRTEASIGRGGFGGFIDQDDVLWSAGTFLRWDTHQHLSTAANSWNNVPDGSFCCAKDPSGNIWVTYEYGRTVLKFDATGAKIGEYPNGDRYGQGIAIDSTTGDVWVAHSHCGFSVGHLKNDGTYVGSVSTAHGPTAVAFDRKGRLWVSTTSGVVQRINTLGGAIGKDGVTPVGTVELTSPFLDGYLWTYGDFTGSSSALQTARGLWTVVFDSGLSNAPWAGLSWDALIANDGDLPVSVATSEDGTTFSALQPITLENSQPTNNGRYLEVVVNFVPATSGEGPTLQNMNVGTVGWPVPAAIQQWNVSGGGNVNAYWPDAVQIKGVVLRSAHKIAVNPTIQWSMISGPGTVTFDNPNVIQPTVHFSTNGIYQFRVTANNNGDVRSDDITVSMTPYNRAPWADAGPNLFVQDAATGVATLQGAVHDDGMPVNNTLKIQWTQLFGPGTTTFGNSNNAVTSATFSTNGIYVLQLSGDDGEFISKATVTVRVGTICTVSDVPNLEAWWQANGTGDDHANGNEAFLQNGANYVQGKVGPAFNFDGNNAQVSVGANPHINLTKASNPGFTMEFWINPNSFLSGGVMGWPGGVRIERFTSGTSSVGDSLHFYLAGTNSGQFVDALRIWPGTSSTNQWFHIALTYDRPSTVAKVFLNGVLLNSGAVGTNLLSTSAEFYMGKIPGSAGAFKGQLDEVSLYSRALDPEEIYNIFASSGAGKCPLEGNQAPTVDAGPDLFLRGIPATATLNGQVFDDGLPVGSSIRVQWTKLNGPGTVTFGSPTTAVTTATFSTNGIYVLQLAANDGDVQTTSLVEVRVESLCTIDDPQGLAAWWPGNNSDVEVLNGADAIQGSGETYTTGKVASAFSFNSINNYVWMLAKTNYDVGSSAAGFTLECWVNPQGFQNGSMLGWANGVRVERFSGGSAVGDSLHFYVCGTNSGQFVDALRIWPGTASTNVWCHLALTYDRTLGQAKVYTNGILIATGTVGSNVMSTAGDFYLGQVPGSSNFFNGALDEISIYKRPLNPEEIYNVFASGSAGKCPNDSNQPPTVYAGADQFVRGVPGVATLQGQVSDDGLPTGSTLRTQWSKFSGPGTVTFSDSNSPTATTIFSTNGVYVLKLTADDGEAQASDLVEVRVESLCTVDNVQGLVAWWPGNGSSDDVVNGYHALLGNGTTYTNGEVASAFGFNGVNNYVWMPAQSAYNAGTSAAGFTLEFWVNPTTFQNGSLLGWANGVRVERFSSGGATGDSLHFYVGGTNNGQFIDARLWPGTQFTNHFYHVALTYDRALGQAKIYTNGVLVVAGSVGTNVMSTAGDFYLGQVPGSAGFFGGVLDEISIYKRPLAPDEVYNVFVSGSTGKCPDDQNQAPVVFAGINVTLVSTNVAATLNGFVSDDGLPAGSTLRTQWSRFAGPGTVTFNNSNSLSTTATFSTNGVYLLQLTADDSEAKSSSLMQVRVGVTCSITDPSGLVAFWPANGSSDDIVNGYHAFLGSGTTYTNGEVGSAFGFNGATNYVWMPSQTNYNVGPSSAGFSVEFWVNPTSLLNGGVLGWANGVRLERFSSGSATGDSLHFYVAGTNSGQFVDALRLWPSPTFTNRFYHVALTYDRTLGQAKIYTNGLLAVTGTVGTNLLSTAGDFFLGQVPGASSFFVGALDEVSIYNRPLALAEVQSIFNAGASGKCISPHNQAPFVYASGNHTIYLPTNTVTLSGAIYDDGLPSNSLAVAWNYVSGPASVFFSSTNTAITTVTFTNTGVYTFQLSATDGQYTTSDAAVVTVLPDPRTPPTVTIAGPGGGAAFEVPNASATTNITFIASASDADGAIARLDLFEDNSLVATLTNAPYSITASNITVGQHIFTVVATDNDGLSTTSSPVNLTVYVDTPPSTTIYTPDDSAIITAPTAIVGTINSPILQSYQLQYRYKAAEGATSNVWITLASGAAPITSNTIATFDPTLLLNGIYELQLTATDTKGRITSTGTNTVIVDRNLKIGQFTVSFNDLSIPVAGMPIQIVRTYDSRAAAAGIQGDFGIGWTLDIHNVRLQKNRSLHANWDESVSGSATDFSLAYHLDPVQPRIITIIFPDGKTEKFRLDPNPLDQALAPIGNPKWRFTPLGSTRGTLVPAGYDQPDGQFLEFTGSIPGTGDLVDLNYFSEWLNGNNTDPDAFLRNPTAFRYTSVEGYQYLIDEVVGLQSVTDPNGNTLVLSTNGITWQNTGVGTNKLSVAFKRDFSGRITNIINAAGNAMAYSYATNGNLVQFIDRTGQTNGFLYTNATFVHHLTGIVDAFGVTPMSNEYDDSGRLVRNTDAFGNAFKYVHNIDNLTTSVIDRNGNSLSQQFDEEGNLIRAVDALGGVTTCTYDEDGRRLSRTNPLGQTERYVYNSTNGALITVINALNQTNTFDYNTNGQVTRATERDGTPIVAEYDSSNNVTRVLDTLSNATVYAYNQWGKAVYSRDALSNEVHSSYDEFGNLVRATNALGFISEFTYDINNRITSEVVTRTVDGVPQRLTNSWAYDAAGRVVLASAPDGSTHQTVYDAAGHIASTIDELGRTTISRYDVLGRLIQTIYPDGSNDGISYDANDRKIATTNRLGQVTRYFYDALNRPAVTLLADGSGTTNFYDAASRVIAATDARGATTYFAYDAIGRVIATTNALGQVSQFTYDARGNQIASTDPLGRTTTNVFDLANRLTSIQYPDGTSTTNNYDALGRKISEIDQLGRTTSYGFDALNRLVAVTNALGQVTRYEYDELGEQTAQIDASGRITRYKYDVCGRRNSRILPLGQADFAVYDSVGNMLAYRDFNGHTTSYRYDALNHLVQKTPDPLLNQPSVAFVYNALGQRTQMTDASGVTTYRYDDLNRLIEKSTPEGALNYAHDSNGNVTSIRSSNTNGVQVSYDYDALNRLATVNDGRLGTTVYNYDAAGNLRNVTYPNAVRHEYAYDTLNRLTNVVGSRFANNLTGYTYTLDATGHRSSVTELNGRVVNYAYDLLNRITGETVVGGSGPGTATYTYDSVGNRLSRNSNLPGVLATTYNYDANDRLLSDTYDNNGNTRTASLHNPVTQQLQPVNDLYDFENQLINRNAGEVNIVYDADGNRVQKTVNTATNTVSTYYLVDDLNPSGYPQVMEELTVDTSNPLLQAPAVTRTYTWGQTLISQDQLTMTTWTDSFYGYDGQGSVRYLTDHDGKVTDTFDFDAFGNLLSRTGNTPNNYLYQGEQYDWDLKLYYLRARYADPDRGRFWTMDSFEGFGTDPLSLHKYTFNNNDPINRHDPSGHMTLTEEMTVSGLGPVVRGAIQSMAQSYLTCKAITATVTATQGAALGGFIGVGIEAVIQAFTGTRDFDAIFQSAVEGAAQGAQDGFMLGAFGDMRVVMMAYNGYQSLLSGYRFVQDISNPAVPLYQRYLDALTFVTSALPVIAPNLSRLLYDKLQKFCFTAGTEVATADGHKPIETIKEGDLVWSQSDETGELALKRVRQKFVNIAAAVVVLHFGTNTLEATPEHPLWVVNEGWKAANQINVGDELWTRTGGLVTVCSVDWKQGQFTVYNFEVESSHTYFVSRSELLTHNKCSARRLFMGKNPGKNSAVGEAVIARMKAEGKIQVKDGVEVFWSEKGQKWSPVSEADMAHKTPAVTWWNNEGRFYGPRSDEVRSFMRNPENYELEIPSINRSEGASLGQKYLPPANPSDWSNWSL